MAETLIKLDDHHFAYLVESNLTEDQMQRLKETWTKTWPGTSLFVIRADRFVDLTGKAVVVERR